MAYKPKEWVCGDTITAEELNRMEQGIKNAIGYDINISDEVIFDGTVPYSSEKVFNNADTENALRQTMRSGGDLQIECNDEKTANYWSVNTMSTGKGYNLYFNNETNDCLEYFYREADGFDNGQFALYSNGSLIEEPNSRTLKIIKREVVGSVSDEFIEAIKIATSY